MTATPRHARVHRSATGADAVRFSDDVTIFPALTASEGEPFSAYSATFRAGAVAELPAPYAEVWVVLSGVLGVGSGDDAVTASPGDFVHVPEQAPGVVEVLEDALVVCISVPAH